MTGTDAFLVDGQKWKLLVTAHPMDSTVSRYMKNNGKKTFGRPPNSEVHPEQSAEVLQRLLVHDEEVPLPIRLVRREAGHVQNVL